MEELGNFSKYVEAKYPSDDTEFFFHKIELEDKMIINVQINGAMDMTFDIPDTFRKSNPGFLDAAHEEEDVEVEPVILLGNHKNMKVQVVASQIGKLVLLSSNPKSVILSIGTKWFGPGESVQDDDFDKLIFILENIKKLLQI